MIDAKTIADGYYNAKPTACGLTVSKNGYDQFAIEVAIEIEGQDEPVIMTKFCGLDTTPLEKGGSSIEFTMRDAETCGVDTSLSIREWTSVDVEKPIRVKIESDDYGPKLKGIYVPGSGGLIKKQAMEGDRAAMVASNLDAHIAALRAKNAAMTGVPAGSKPAARPAATAARQTVRQPQRSPQRQAPPPGARTQSAPENFTSDDDIPF